MNTHLVPAVAPILSGAIDARPQSVLVEPLSSPLRSPPLIADGGIVHRTWVCRQDIVDIYGGSQIGETSAPYNGTGYSSKRFAALNGLCANRGPQGILGANKPRLIAQAWHNRAVQRP
jgi:hypothetical protein